MKSLLKKRQRRNFSILGEKRIAFMIAGDEGIRFERIMERRKEREGIPIRSSTLDALIDREINAKRKPRFNDQTEESLIVVDGMPSF